MNRKHKQSIYHANINVNVMEQNFIPTTGRVTINVNVIVKNIIYVKKNIFGIQLYAFVKNGKYLASMVDNSAIICEEVIVIDVDDKTKTIPINFNENKLTCKTPKIFILFASLLITIVLLRAVSIYCYLIKYQVN